MKGEDCGCGGKCAPMHEKKGDKPMLRKDKKLALKKKPDKRAHGRGE